MLVPCNAEVYLTKHHLTKLISQVTSWVVHLAPIGVCFLIAGEILHMKSVLAELTKLAW